MFICQDNVRWMSNPFWLFAFYYVRCNACLKGGGGDKKETLKAGPNYGMCHHRRRCGRECSRRCACCATEYIQEFFLAREKRFYKLLHVSDRNVSLVVVGPAAKCERIFASIKMAVSVWRLHFAFFSRLGGWCISTHLKLHGPLDAMLLMYK